MIQSAFLTRYDLGLGDLSLTSSKIQADVEGPEGSGLTWRRRTVQSPYVDGTFEVSATRDAGLLTLKCWVLGTSGAELRTTTRELLAAVEQVNFALAFTADEFDWRYYCYRADYSVGLKSGHVRGLAVPVTLSIPYAPNYGLV